MTLTPRGIAVTLAAFVVAGCQRHVQLKFPDTSPGAQYTCSVTESQVESCRPRTDINAADDNRDGTVFVILPRACAGRFNEITIHDSGSSEPSVNVRCAPLENRVVLPPAANPAPPLAGPAAPVGSAVPAPPPAPPTPPLTPVP